MIYHHNTSYTIRNQDNKVCDNKNLFRHIIILMFELEEFYQNNLIMEGLETAQASDLIGCRLLSFDGSLKLQAYRLILFCLSCSYFSSS